MVVLLVTIITGIYKLRIRSLQQQRDLLEKQVEARTKEVLEQKKSLELINAELRDLNRERTGMMGIVAHDLKSPLNNIQSFIELMRLEGDLNDNQREYMERVKVIVDQSKDLIRDLVDIHAMEDRGDDLKSTEVNLGELIKEHIDSHQNALSKKEQKIHFELPTNDMIVITDKVYLARIFDNLLSNAIKFSPLNSNINIKVSQEDNEISFTVKDDGPGIKENEKHMMFKPFQKLSARPTGGESSTGLGLSIIKALVIKLRGRIEVITEEGVGSEFIVYIPNK